MNTLVVYGLLQYPLRSTISDHLYSFRDYGKGRYFYLNLAARRAPRWLHRVPFDTVVFHHTLTGQRMAPSLLRWQLRRARALDRRRPALASRPLRGLAFPARHRTVTPA